MLKNNKKMLYISKKVLFQQVLYFILRLLIITKPCFNEKGDVCFVKIIDSQIIEIWIKNRVFMNFRFYLLYAVLFFIGLSSCTTNVITKLILLGVESYFRDIEEIVPPNVISFINNVLRVYVKHALVLTMGGWYTSQVE